MCHLALSALRSGSATSANAGKHLTTRSAPTASYEKSGHATLAGASLPLLISSAPIARIVNEGDHTKHK